MTRSMRSLAGEQRVEGVDDVARPGPSCGGRPSVDLRRHLDGGDQAADGAGADGDGDGADGAEEVVLDVARHVGGRPSRRAPGSPRRPWSGGRPASSSGSWRSTERRSGFRSTMTKRTVSTRSFHDRPSAARGRCGAGAPAAPASRLARDRLGRSSRHQPNFLRNSMMRRASAASNRGPSRKARGRRAATIAERLG